MSMTLISESGVKAELQGLLNEGRFSEALALSGPIIAAASRPSESVLNLHIRALKGERRLHEARDTCLKATELYPQSPYAWHNLAAMLGDLEEGDAAIDAAERALSLGLKAPQTQLVKARALVALGRLDEADAAYAGLIKAHPGEVDALREHAQLIWMRTGDVHAAEQPYEIAGGSNAHPSILANRARLYEFAGAFDAAHAWAMHATQAQGAGADTFATAAHMALLVEKDEDALGLARRAHTMAPQSLMAMDSLFAVLMATGRADEALALGQLRLKTAPGDQMSWTTIATAGRALGRPVYEELMDYQALVKAYTIETPRGWPTLEAYLADLKACVRDLHLFDAHPISQSLRGGTQTHFKLMHSDAAPIRAFFDAVDAPIRSYMTDLGQSPNHPLKWRNTLEYRIGGAWSVCLRPGGFHVDHMHPEGWLASAFYIDVPDAANDTINRPGWIRFGQPLLRTQPPQPPEHFVQPKPGLLALFPAYMWHGTVPFGGDQERLTLVIDILPG